jgi:tRNA pseudouridine13 synthase
MDSLENIGIRHFNTLGLSGRLFEREEDFIVREIEEDGEVLNVERTEPNIPGDKKDYLVFTLVKRGISTPEAVRFLSRNLHISFKRIAYNGNKDKRALTSQRMSIFKFDAEKLRIDSDRIFVRDLTYSDTPCKIGKLYGNSFKVTVKDFEVNGRDLDEIGKEISDGVPNFYGPQRFGSSSLNIEVSKSMLRGDFKSAFFSLVLKERADSRINAEKRRALRESLNLEDISGSGAEKTKEVLKTLPGFMYFERESISYLLEHKNDYAGAIRLMPKYARLIILQSFQYYVFNETLSRLLDNNERNIPEEIPTIGYDAEINSDIDEITTGILSREGIDKDMLKMKSMPEASLKTFSRKIWIKPENFKIERGESTATVSFSLKKGEYATIVLFRLFGAPLNNQL